MPDGSRKSIDRPAYTMEVSFSSSHAHALTARSITVPIPRHLARSDHGAATRGSVPQQLMWHMLGFPSKNIWLHTPDVTVDQGLPGASHLSYDFPVLDAVARARAKALPFHEMRDGDELLAPGAVVYMYFAGPLIGSYPHEFTSYCKAVDTGSGYARILPCHSPTADVARQCLELLLSDLRALMGLTHKLRPQVIVSGQDTVHESPFQGLYGRRADETLAVHNIHATTECGGRTHVWHKVKVQHGALAVEIRQPGTGDAPVRFTVRKLDYQPLASEL